MVKRTEPAKICKRSDRKISFYDLTQEGGIEKLERDGVSRSNISKELYRHTDGLSQAGRTEIVRKLYRREYE